MSYTVYCHLFPNGKRYIGLTSGKPEYRWGNGNGYSGQVLMKRSIEKYGWENVEHIILDEGLSKEEAIEKEKFYISQYHTQEDEFGYNLTEGGEGHSGYSPTEETRKKLSEAGKRRGNSWVTEELREKRRVAATGRRHSEETKNKIREAMKRRGNSYVTEEMRRKISLANIGNTHTKGSTQTPESNKKRSDALKGIPKSEETKAKMRKPKSKEAVENMRKASQLRWKKYYEDKAKLEDLTKQSGV